MFNKFTFQNNVTQKVFFTADSHWGHDKTFIYEKRGFRTIQEHDQALIDNWNAVVGVNDNVIHLGDFLVGAGTNAFKYGQEILFRLNGHIHLIWGNHNSYVKDIYRMAVKEILPQAVETTELYPVTYSNKITFYGNNLLARIKGDDYYQYVFCSHFAHRIWIDSHKGSVIHISGHSHGSDPESQLEFAGAQRLDVGVDNFIQPVSFKQLKAIMKNKSVAQIDHHNSLTSPSI